ncbi:integration host factor subunit beta [bacterium]|nr:integration host factor subunit beta [bacterium]
MKLKKSELIERLANEMDGFPEETSTKAKTDIARDTVNLFFDSIKETLASGDRVELRGFGSFNVKEYEGYTGRNPKTGEKVQVHAKKLPVFRAGRELRKIVDK